MGFTGPYQPIFDDVRMGVSAPPLGALEGTWRPTGSSEHTEAQFHLAGLGAPAPLRIDALWRGAIVARFAPGGEPKYVIGTRRRTTANCPRSSPM